LDEVDSVVMAAKYIKEHVGQRFNVCLRPHPGDKRRFDIWHEKSNQIGVSYSAPEIECSSDVIIKSNVVVAADSNILLEAALLRALPICMPFTGKIMDHYGFIRNGVVFYAENPIELVKAINNNPNEDVFYHSAKQYSHVVGTNYEGLSTKLIARTLSDLAETKNIPDVWHLNDKNVFEAS
jgi:hypothetical protein